MAQLISWLFGELQPAIGSSRGDIIKDHPSTCGHLTSLRNKPQQKHPEKFLASIPAEFLS